MGENGSNQLSYADELIIDSVQMDTTGVQSGSSLL